MGGSSSSPSPSPYLDAAWRNVDWGNKESLLKSVKEYSREDEDIKHINILLYGPVGSGKSSFVNSVSSVLKGSMSQRASVGAGDGSFTLQKLIKEVLLCQALGHRDLQAKEQAKYRTYKMNAHKGQAPFVFSDIMGLEAESGIHVKDIKLVMKGHAMDKYKFNRDKGMSTRDKLYKHDPTPDDQMHVVVCVVPADQVENLADEVVVKIRMVRLAARDLGIPYVCIITKIDTVDPLMKADVKRVYKMKIVKQTMEAFSEKTGIPMNSIFPVKNYHEEADLKNDVDVLILKALKHMISVGEDFVDDL